MRRRLQSTQDFWTGLVFAVFGAATAIHAYAYPMGTASRMGPGYFPRLLGVILALIGIGLVARAFTSAGGGQVARLDLPLLLRLLLSLVAFGLLLAPLGVILAALIAILIAAWAGPEFNPGEAIVTALVLTMGSWMLFVFALKQTMPVWPKPLASILGL